MITDRRQGRFKIAIEEIEKYPEAVRKVMGVCIVLKADYSFTSHSVEYLALCDDFLEVAEGSIAPEYEIEFDDETDTVNWTLSE